MAVVKFEFLSVPINYGTYTESEALKNLIDEFCERVEKDSRYIALSNKYHESAVILSPYNAALAKIGGDICVCVTNVNATMSYRSLATNIHFPEESYRSTDEIMNALSWVVNGHLAPNNTIFEINSTYLLIKSDLLSLDLLDDVRNTLIEEAIDGYLNREEVRMMKARAESSESIFGKTAEVQTDYVFVIMPFSNQLDEVYNMAVKTVLRAEPFNFRVERADEIFQSGQIMKQIWSSISKARFIIADMTGRNPNVMYELGIAHTLGKEVIMITQEINDIPFDLRHLRHLSYGVTPTAFEKLKIGLSSYAENILNGGQDISV